jgi:thiamine pyrophosphate-dependent acetolactate synthase large subunit-like protein
MSEITGGELFARALQAEGIEFLFGLPSPEIDPLLAELAALRTDHDANLSVPAEMAARFFEVYFGPAKPASV